MVRVMTALSALCSTPWYGWPLVVAAAFVIGGWFGMVVMALAVIAKDRREVQRHD